MYVALRVMFAYIANCALYIPGPFPGLKDEDILCMQPGPVDRPRATLYLAIMASCVGYVAHALYINGPRIQFDN